MENLESLELPFTEAIPINFDINRDIFVEADVGRTLKIPEMNYIEYDEPPPTAGRPGLYHPLCCYVRAQYYMNGVSKTEIMEDLKCMAVTTETQKQHRTALRYLCYHILGVKNLDKTQKDINIRIGFRDEVYKAAIKFLFAPNSTAVCNHWAYNAFKSNVVFTRAKQGMNATVSYQDLIGEMRRVKQRRSNQATNNSFRRPIVID